MIATSAIAFPATEMFIRNSLIRDVGFFEAGIWQGSIKISNAYLSLIGVYLVYYFMPVVSAEADKKVIAQHVWKILKILSLVFIAGGMILYFGRNLLIPLLLSRDFEILENFILYQLIGDFFKILGHAIGFVAVAKAASKLYIFAEIFQSILLITLFNVLVIYLTALSSAFVAYMLTYSAYFLISLCVFYCWQKRKSD